MNSTTNDCGEKKDHATETTGFGAKKRTRPARPKKTTCPTTTLGATITGAATTTVLTTTVLATTVPVVSHTLGRCGSELVTTKRTGSIEEQDRLVRELCCEQSVTSCVLLYRYEALYGPCDDDHKSRLIMSLAKQNLYIRDKRRRSGRKTGRRSKSCPATLSRREKSSWLHASPVDIRGIEAEAAVVRLERSAVVRLER